jgi:hypothetical protein
MKLLKLLAGVIEKSFNWLISFFNYHSGYFDIDDPRSSPILQTVKLPVVNIDNCRKIKQLSHFNFSKGHLCVGGIAGKG